MPRCDVNLVHLSNTGRHIHISAQGSVCEADPNRIFSDAAIATLWSRWNPRRPCASDPVKADAIGQIAAFRDQQLWPAIRRCMGVPGTLDEEAAAGIWPGGASIAAFHNNDPSPSIDILAYCPGPGGPPGCGGQLGSEARRGLFNGHSPESCGNQRGCAETRRRDHTGHGHADRRNRRYSAVVAAPPG